MVTENLIYHSSGQGFASYGRDGGQGRDIVIAPSEDLNTDRALVNEIRTDETSVVGILDCAPVEEIESSLNRLMPIWNKARHGNVYIAYEAPNARSFCDGFYEAAMRNFKRQGLPVDSINRSMLAGLQYDLERSVSLMSDVVKTNEQMTFRMLYYPPASAPLRIFHDWHADSYPPSLMGKLRLQRSLNHDGIRFAFKEQADPERVLAGIGTSVGRAVFKITPDNIHSAPPVSPLVGRAMYTVTGTPTFDIR